MSVVCISMVHFSTLLIADFLLLTSFIISHPLYFSYFLFFSPYLYRLVSFLSPLLFTTSILFCTFLTIIGQENLSPRSVEILLRACTSMGASKSKNDHRNEEFQSFEYIAMFEIVFGSSMTQSDGNPVEIIEEKFEEVAHGTLESAQMDDPGLNDNGTGKYESSAKNKEMMSPVAVNEIGKAFGVSMEEERLVNFLKILDEFKMISSFTVEEQERKKAAPSTGTRNSKVVGKTLTAAVGPEAKDEGTACTLLTTHSQKISPIIDHSFHQEDCKEMVRVESCPGFDYKNLPSSGSMRKEKEWKRTLACKLFEERYGVGRSGCQGMDSLWEVYEAERDIPAPAKDKNMNKSKAKKKSEMMEKAGGDGPVCCLQALKFSTGKIYFGIGRPYVARISKAMRGIRWMQHVSKKIHNNGDK